MYGHKKGSAVEKKVDYQAQWKKNKGKVKIELGNLELEELAEKGMKSVQRLGRIEIRISDIEHELIKQKAEEEGLSISLYMKQKALGKKLPKRVNENNVNKVLRLASR